MGMELGFSIEGINGEFAGGGVKAVYSWTKSLRDD